MAEEFSGQADLFTLAYNSETTLPEFKEMPIRVSFLDSCISTHNQFKTMFPISTYVMQAWDFRDYDIILTSSASTAKYIRKFHGRHICYCYYPTRAVWLNDRYFGDQNYGIKSTIFKTFLPYFKRRDLAAASRVDKFVAISETSRQAINSYYGQDAEVLFCPIEVKHFTKGMSELKGDSYLIVSRLETWKNLDYAIDAFNCLKLPLDIIGEGADAARLKAMSRNNISFLGGVGDDDLVRAYGQAKGVIFTPELEYGLVPLEAVAAGTPVIALGRGGVRETMVDVADHPDRKQATAIFYPEPTAKSLMSALRQFEKTTFDRTELHRHAKMFDIPIFKRKLRQIIEHEADLAGL
jgi:glycosyltransferase involved in cell wall biosynthesis